MVVVVLLLAMMVVQVGPIQQLTSRANAVGAQMLQASGRLKPGVNN